MPSQRKMTYRPEIDGLRAIAVTAVILFHLDIPIFAGGFIGVDVFFVISGYLISTSIFLARDGGGFSLGKFYERRARRILPPLFFTIICCIPFVQRWLLPEQRTDFWESVLTAILSASNFLFWIETGYFSAIAEEKPLLHTWSLAVEEQFYILFPLFLLLIARVYSRRWLEPLTFSLIILLGLLLSEWAWRYHPVANFYLLPFRGWEIVVGVLTAWLQHYYLLPRKRSFPFPLGNIGLAALCFSIVWFSQTTPNPSIITLLPLLATSCILLCMTPTSWSNKVLQSPALVAIGKRSYSAYLWHQPIIALLSVRFAQLPVSFHVATTLIATFILAIFSWRYIERPFQSPNWLGTYPFLVSVLLTTLILGLLGWKHRLLPATDFSEYLTFDSSYYIDESCDNRLRDVCSYGSVNAHIALLGDSHAHALAHGLGTWLESQGQGLRIHVRGGCPPAEHINTGIYNRLNKQYTCPTYNRHTQESIRQDYSIHTVILAARWSAYLSGTRVESERGVWSPVDLMKESRHDVLQAYTNSIEGMLAAGKRVILVYPIPEPRWHLPNHLAQQARFYQLPETLSHSYTDVMQQHQAIYEHFSILQHPDLYHVLPTDLMCDNEACILYEGGVAFYYDDDHVSSAGAKRIIEGIVKHLD